MKASPLSPGGKESKAFERLSRELKKIAVSWPDNLPQPKKFPAKLKDFLHLVVKAKTPADSMARLRSFLIETAPHTSICVVEEVPPKDGVRAIRNLVPKGPFGGDFMESRKSLSEEGRFKWMERILKTINQFDKAGGFFTELRWLAMGSAYLYWWKDKKSIKASNSAKRRKKPR